MIIFGTKGKTKTIDQGQFYCPHCRAQRQYTRQSVRPYFSLYFIPVFPIGQDREFVRCETCGTAFEPDVLGMEPPAPEPDVASLLNNIPRRLDAGRPVEYLVRDLTAAGLDYDVARANVMTHIGDDRQTCPACGLTYAPGVGRCAVCDGPLHPAAE